MRKTFFFIVFLILLPLKNVCLAENVYDKKVYNEQYVDSGAKKFFDELPGEVKKSFGDIGVNPEDFNSIVDIKPESILENILNTAKKKMPGPVKSISIILAVIFLNSIFNTLKVSMGEKPLSAVLGVVSTLCICITIIVPIVNFIGRIVTIIKAAASLLICYVPIMVGIMVASGQVISSVAFSSLMLALGDGITQLASLFLLPLLNIFLAISIVSAISSKFTFFGLCEMFSKIIKWVLGFGMTIFSGLLTTKSLIGSAVDSVNSKTMKFVLSSFVPVVGSALGDAFLTVQGCVKILKSSVGAFFIIAIGFVFFPVIIECIIWLIGLNICVVAGDIFDLSNLSKLLKNIGTVVSTLMAIILCVMTILIISTVIVLNIGGASG